MKIFTLAALATLALGTAATASNFSVSGPGGAIPDPAAAPGTWNTTYTGTAFTSTVAVANPVTSITAVKLNGLTHTWRGDLHIILRDPASVAYNVVVRPGSTGTSVGDSGDYQVGLYTFVDAGGGTVAQGTTNIAPGTYNIFQNTGTGQWTLGMNNVPLSTITGPAGNWTLEIRDWAALDVGSLTGWTLEGTDAVTPIVSFCAGDGTLTDHTTPCPCANNGAAGNGCANSANAAGANLTTTGLPSTDDVVLAGSGMPLTVSCIYLQGDALNDGVFGDGVRCAGGSLIRLRTKTNAGGASSFPDSTDTITLSARGGVTVGSGARRYYQTYYRNSAAAFCPPETFNVTNGIQIDW
ncbi:MAG: hypothetical protein IPJ77_14275 [Planctomycetes bacterium]|nr:hypothetical protein [Planctomycetota bacterium]